MYIFIATARGEGVTRDRPIASRRQRRGANSARRYCNVVGHGRETAINSGFGTRIIALKTHKLNAYNSHKEPLCTHFQILFDYYSIF